MGPFFALILFLTCGAAGAADGFFTASDGVTLHYVEQGSGPLVAFVPGWTMGASIWQAQLDFFSARDHVAALDPRCQGLSGKTAKGLTVERRAQDIAEWLDHLKAGPCVLVGWSMGGSEALVYAAAHPGRLAGLVLVDAPPGMPPSRAQIVKREALLGRVGTERVKETNAFVRWMFKKPHPEEYYDAIVQQALKTPTDAALALLRDLYAVQGWKVDYAKIQIPVLCFASESYYPQGLWLQKRIPGLRLQEMKGDGHALFADDPKGFNPRLQDFLSQTQSK